MFDNIGGKIKGLAKAIFIIATIIFIIAGLVMLSDGGDTAMITGIVTIIVGPLAAWVSSWLLYGFGELIEKTTEIAENTRK